MAWRGEAWQGVAGLGEPRRGRAWSGEAWQGMAGPAGQDERRARSPTPTGRVELSGRGPNNYPMPIIPRNG
jgi:hypothetical protein